MDIEKFQQFIFEMDDVLESFVESTGISDKLDYSVESLDELETYLSQELECSEKDRNRSARYLGEVFRKNYGGHWDLCNDGPNFLYNGLPVIKDFSDIDFDFCPLAVIHNYLSFRRQGLLVTAVKSCVNP